MVGSAVVRRLQSTGFVNLILPRRRELDLLDQRATLAFLETERPDFVIVAAAKVGGIYANDTRRGQFIYENLAIETNLIHGAHVAGVQDLIFMGSSCVYPRDCPQPIREEYLLTGPLEPTNESYAVAKIAGIKMCDAYRNQYGRRYVSVMPTNLYGPNDNYDLTSSHVLPALIRKTVDAFNRGDDQVVVWGSGRPRREFLHVDDLAEACVFLMTNAWELSPPLINIGYGEDVSIEELARTIMDVIGFKGRLAFDVSKPDGTPRKLLDTRLINQLGWRPRITLRDGIRISWQDYLASSSHA
jgi:GDP-L-fucose synthase